MKTGIRQHDIRDCGAACLATILLWYGSNVPLIEIRQKMRVDRNGVSMFAICKVAEMFGLGANGYHAEFSDFVENINRHNIKLPIIVHTILKNNLHHYMIVKKICHNSVHVFDPQIGERKYTLSEFENIFFGYFIMLAPNDRFVQRKRNWGRYKKYIKIITKQKTLFLMSILCSIISAMASIMASLAYQIIIDRHILGGGKNLLDIPIFTKCFDYIDMNCATLVQLLIAVMGIYLLQGLIGGARGVLITYIYRNSSQHLVYKYYKHLLRLPIPFFHDRETGEIISRYGDIGEIQDVISGIGLTVILNISMAIAGGIVLYSISPTMLLVVIVMIAMYGLIAFIYKKPIREINRNMMEADSQVTCELKEVVGGIESVKAFSCEQIFYSRLHKKTEDLIEKSKKGSLISVSQSTILSLIEGIGSILILWSGCYFTLKGELSLGQFIAFETLVYFFISPIESLLLLQIELQKGFVAAERLDDILEVEKEREAENSSIIKNMPSVDSFHIEVKNLTFAYGFRESILEDLSFEIKPAEKVLIKGKSGCGKTTLLHLLSKMEADYEGTICFGMEELKSISTSTFRKHVIYVPQNAELFSGTIMENILLERTVDKDKLHSIIRGCQLDEFINSLEDGFNKVIEENGKNLSGGQKQRIALARALVMEPKVLLLDESMCHLDEETEKKVLDYLWNGFQNMTIIVVSHKGNLQNMCDKVIEI